ncbi:hypothetical protein C0991_011730 [Blastosporella zonata]|nr:hypothetical protein C0991_011730 [Blastosporella zonata]
MFSSSPTNNNLEAIALSYIQPESALSAEDGPPLHDLPVVSPLNVPPTTHWSKDRTRRLSRTPAASSLTGSSKSKVEPVAVVTTSPFELPSAATSQAGLTSGLRARSSIHSTAPALTPEQKRHRKFALLHLVTICCAIFGEGWNDGSNGPLLPAFQRQYKNAQANGFVSSLSENMETKLGIMHAMYGAPPPPSSQSTQRTHNMCT